MNYEIKSELEDIQFKYERISSIVDMMQMLISECDIVEVKGIQPTSISYSLYEIREELDATNDRLDKAIIDLFCQRPETVLAQ